MLGRADFIRRNQALRAEIEAFGAAVADAQWYDQQLRFIQTHRYWTVAAHMLHDDQNCVNCAALVRLLEECKS